MYTVTVRDRMMVAHSLTGEVFGPAQRLHGATYVVDVTFSRTDLDEHGTVLDLGLAARVVRAVLADLDYRNLDEEPSLAGRNTTTEVLAREVADRLCARVGDGLPEGLAGVRVVLHESDVASAGYERAP